MFHASSQVVKSREFNFGLRALKFSARPYIAVNIIQLLRCVNVRYIRPTQRPSPVVLCYFWRACV